MQPQLFSIKTKKMTKVSSTRNSIVSRSKASRDSSPRCRRRKFRTLLALPLILLATTIVPDICSQHDSSSSSSSSSSAAAQSCQASKGEGDVAGSSSCLDRSASPGDGSSCRDHDPLACQTAGGDHCDIDPSWMLIHCHKTCSICIDEPCDVKIANNCPQHQKQTAGLDKLPFEESIEVLQVIRRTHLYFKTILLDYRNDPDQIEQHKYTLVVNDPVYCRDHQELCAFWAHRGQCENPDYSTYMSRECPLTCQLCGTDLSRGRAFLRLLLGNLTEAYDGHDDHESSSNGDLDENLAESSARNSEQKMVASRHRSLSLLMSTVGMDPNLLIQPLRKEDGNWLKILHERVYALIPMALLKLYRDTGNMSGMPDDYFELLAILHGVTDFKTATDRSRILSMMLMPYRSRGSIVSIMREFDHLVTRPIQLGVGFAVPNEVALMKIQEFAHDNGNGILQMGAGAGYWASLLQLRGIRVLAYDIDPPLVGDRNGVDEKSSRSSNTNVFFDVAYMDSIQQGACKEVFSSNPTLARENVLLLIWPNDPDPVDNLQFCGDGDCENSQPVWDADCLDAYLRAGGQKVIYVGERESQIIKRNGGSADCGISSTRKFQQLLIDRFSLSDSIEIPNWWLNEDDVTLWERRPF